jgi:hypothetical protein
MFDKKDNAGRRSVAEETIKFCGNMPRNADILTQTVIDVSIAQRHSFLGNTIKAIRIANRIDIDSPDIREGSTALSIYIILFRLYLTTNSGYEIDRLRKILIFIKDNLEGTKLRIEGDKLRIEGAKLSLENPKYCVSPQSITNKKLKYNYDLVFCVDDLLPVYAKLAEVDLNIVPDPSSCLSWCDKAWALAQEAVMENCDTDQVFKICILAFSRSQGACTVKWCCNTLNCLKAMLTQGKLTNNMAEAYVIAQRIVFSSNPGNNFIVINPLIFLETIENDPSIGEGILMAFECWLCGFWLSRSNGWSTAKGRKAYMLLSKSLRLFPHDFMANEVYAHALGLVADAHLAQGKTALAVDEFTEAKRLMSKLLGENHPLSKQCQAGLEKALAQA